VHCLVWQVWFIVDHSKVSSPLCRIPGREGLFNNIVLDFGTLPTGLFR
jgi:hypothetical protein